MDEIISQSLSIFFGVLQSLILVVISGAFKMFMDIRDLKKDLNAAFLKIRELEKLVTRDCEIVGASARSCREGKDPQ